MNFLHEIMANEKKGKKKVVYLLGGTQSVWALNKTPCLQFCAYIDQPENYFLQTVALFWQERLKSVSHPTTGQLLSQLA